MSAIDPASQPREKRTLNVRIETRQKAISCNLTNQLRFNSATVPRLILTARPKKRKANCVVGLFVTASSS